MSDQIKVQKMNIEYFLNWLEAKFNEKYESSLEGLKDRFVALYSICKVILENIMELNLLLQKDQTDTSTYDTYKPLLDNMVRLFELMLKETPEILDFDLCEDFFITFPERIQIFFAQFHSIKHLSHSDPNVMNNASKIIKIIDNASKLISKAFSDLKTRANLSSFLLKHIKEQKNYLLFPIKKFKEEFHNLSLNNSFEEYETLMEDVKNRSKGNMKIKLDFVNKMIDLVKEGGQYNFDLNKMIKTYCSMANIIKQKGKRVLNENLQPNDQAKLLKFVTLLLRPDFINNVLIQLENSEILYIINLFESQSNLVNEYKKTLSKGIEEFKTLNIIEFEITLEKYKQVMNEIIAFQEVAQKNFEMVKFNKETTSQMLKDIRKVVDKYKELQNGIFHYQEILDFFNKIRTLAAKNCYAEFNVRIELICEYNYDD